MPAIKMLVASFGTLVESLKIVIFFKKKSLYNTSYYIPITSITT